MSDDLLFCRYDLRQIIDGHRAGLRQELDGMPDSRLLNTDPAALQSYAVDKYTIHLPVLGEPVVDESRAKMEVGRYGEYPTRGEETFSVDARRYTLEVPFEGDHQLLWARGSTFSSCPPRGVVRDGMLSMTIVERTPDSEKLNREFDRFLADVRQHLGWLKNQIDAWNSSIPGEVAQVVAQRQQRAEKAGAVASGLKFGIKQRTDRATTYATPVTQRKRITHQLPAAKPGMRPEPVLTNETYLAILDTLKQMSLVMERSPHAYATLDEEALRFQFLVPLNANFEGDARAEVFNYGGKTDILITVQGKNIFIGECKFWKGPKALTETVDQILRYLAWRDTKCAILLFNRNKNFSQVLGQVRPTLEQHAHHVSFDGSRGESELTFTFKRPDDAARRLELLPVSWTPP